MGLEGNKIFVLGAWIVLGSIGVFLASYVIRTVFQDNAFQVKHIAVKGSYSQVDTALLESFLKGYVGAGFFMLDTETIKKKVRSFPWVKDARVSKIWPDRLEVKIWQKKVLVGWSKGGYVDMDGNIFTPNKPPVVSPETVFIGDESKLLKMVAVYNQVSSLFRRHGKRIAVEKMDEFGNLEIITDDDQLYRVGSVNHKKSIENYFQYQSRIIRSSIEKIRIKEVDMRYSNGFAVKRAG